jgi:hypothetical protein
MCGAVSVLDDVKGLVPLIEALFDEREEHSIFFVLVIEKGADVSGPTQRCACQFHLLLCRTHTSSFAGASYDRVRGI